MSESVDMVCAPPPKRDVNVTQQHDIEFVFRNLDSGEERPLGVADLDSSFICSPDEKQLLRINDGVSPWATWWSEKRHLDDKLRRAAATGSATAIHNLFAATDSSGGAAPDINCKSLHGLSALHVASSSGHQDCVKTLLSFKACVNQQTTSGRTALHYACERGDLKVASTLLNAGADVFCEAEDGSLPVHVAAARGHAPLVSLLLGYGQEQVNARNSLQQRPEDLAGNIDVALLLRKAREDNRELNAGYAGQSKWNEEPIDAYAGRTSFKGGVLLRNSRSDVVLRLLRGKQDCKEPPSPERKQPPVPDGGIHPSEISTMTPASKCSQLLSGSKMSTRSKAHSSPNSSLLRRVARHMSPSAFILRRRREPFAKLLPDDNLPFGEKVGPQSFELLNALKINSFAETFHVQHKMSGKECLMKTFQKNKLKQKNLWKEAKNERNVLAYLHHPYIVRLHATFQTSSHLVLVLQHCPGGSVQQLINQEGRLHEKIARHYTAEVLLALEYLHDRDVVFRDLKPASVALDEGRHCMLTDFGLTKEGVTGLSGGKSYCGPIPFLAPEVISKQRYGQAVDLYGLGVFLFCMVVGNPPFFDVDRETMLANIRHARLHLPRFVSSEARSLIMMLMEREPSYRLGVGNTSEVGDHEFFDAIDFEALERREVDVPTLDRDFWLFDQKLDASDDSYLESPFRDVNERLNWRACGTPSPDIQDSPAEDSVSAEKGAVPGWDFARFSFGCHVAEKAGGFRSPVQSATGQ
eukprot:TRINITY_DN43637_c0_g1_i1.p1 TRINITY_DN43637_c0_g1~~TRINITY_DN43637_c0_g1_i1.p1  ORF type:complete len:752 (-),score=141.79 TRINITY_DN43637_c0_g1_i1:70-2325(-)